MNQKPKKENSALIRRGFGENDKRDPPNSKYIMIRRLINLSMGVQSGVGGMVDALS